MGLDWCVKEKKEGESVSPAQTVGFPKYDPENQEHIDFLKEVYEGYRESYKKEVSYEEFLKETAEQNPFLMDERFLSADCEVCTLGGTGSFMTSPLDFRGKIIGCMGAIIGDDLANRAYNDFEPEEAVEYASELEDCAMRYAKARLDEEQLNLDYNDEKALIPLMGEDAYWNYYWLRRASDWMRYWGDNGHGIFAWY